MKSAIVLQLLLAVCTYATDWPQWLGPDRNGVSNETDLHWPATGPEVRWRIPLGKGFSGISIADGRIFTMFAQGEDEYAICLDTETGSEIWRYRTGPYYQESQGGDGPRSTPTVDGAAQRAGRWRWFNKKNRELEEDAKECGLHYNICHGPAP